MPTLFDPLTIGDIRLPNRVIMAPLTRLRAGEGKVPNGLMAEYYAQRASAGLIISEGVPISQQGVGYPGVAGLWSREHVEGWRGVTRAVKAAGGRIFAQIWHVGRISDPVFQGGRAPVAPSAVTPDGHVSLLRPQRPYVRPRALSTSEIKAIVEDFRRRRAIGPAGGLRRCRAARRERLPARPVPAGRDQSPGRRVRRPDREPGAPPSRSDGRRRLGLGREAGRCPPRASGRPALHGRFRPEGGLRLRRRAARRPRDRLRLRPRARGARQPRAAPQVQDSAASTSPTKASPARAPKPRSRPAGRTRWVSARLTSPTRISRSACGATRR